VGAPDYHETLLSLVVPGNTSSSAAFQPAVLELERRMHWTPELRRHITLRSDGGCGTDANINWQLWRGYHIMTKGFSGKRAQAQGRAIQEWVEVRPGLWIGQMAKPIRYARRTVAFVRRWQDEHQKFKYAIQIHSVLQLSTPEAIQRYDGRGAMVDELQSDKGGLHLARRRKRRLRAQEALVLLTDLAHNNIAWLRPWMFAGSPFAEWGPRRIIRDLFAIPGDVVIKDGQFVKVRLSRAHPYAAAMAGCLAKLLENFETPMS
jgi:Transposase DDE domain group 1